MYVHVVAVPDVSTPYACLLFLVPVSAGYPSPADDYLDGSLDLNRHLIKHPTATFFVRVAGESMREAVATYTTRAAEKLRRAQLAAGVLTVFLMTNRFTDEP